MSTELLKLILQEGSASIDSIVKVAIEGGERAAFVTLLDDKKLDRALADTADKSYMSGILQADSVVEKAAGCQVINEAARIRRDVKAARVGHKRLMFSSLETLYRRGLELKARQNRKD